MSNAEVEPRQGGVFLNAQWRHLVMLNFEIDPAVLAARAPAGTEVDRFDGRAYCSLVGFRFLETRVLGIPIPFHRDFDEINLRFYVRSKGPRGWRRGVVFVSEVVPKLAIVAVARAVYGEAYRRHRTRSMIEGPDHQGGRARFEWRFGGRWQCVGAAYGPEARIPGEGSEEEFITEHYWGYAKRRGGGTTEYQVEHPQWPVRQATKVECEGDWGAFYGPEFVEALSQPPTSAFVAEGSEVAVIRGRRLV
ncbi:MAG: DUF2071 domain-containing protein [Planctomycetota bacterium]